MKTARNKAFTLIELLVVVSIILILAALLMPAIQHMVAQAARSKAATQGIAISIAIKAYRSEYGTWPGQTGDDETDERFRAKPENIVSNLFSNPKNIYFLGNTEHIITNGVFADPWHRPFAIVMDEDGDGTVEVDVDLGNVNFATNVEFETVAVISWGPNPNIPKKRVLSWAY